MTTVAAMRRRPEDPIILCESVEKWFGDFQALAGITTSVREGEVVVICGFYVEVFMIFRIL